MSDHDTAIHDGFFRDIRTVEDKCATFTWSYLSATDSESAECNARLEETASLMYRFAGCYWGCRDSSHLLERLVGRSTTVVLSATRLIGFGYYDEAIGLARTLAETGNLFWLLMQQPGAVDKWLTLDEAKRREQFSAGKVRKKLDSFGLGIPITTEDYDEMCGIGVHLHPNTSPQSFNEERRAVLGSLPQRDGIHRALGLTAYAASFVCGPAFKMSTHEESLTRKATDTSMALFIASRRVLGWDKESTTEPNDARR